MTRDPAHDAGLREELEGPDKAGHATALTGAGGEAGRSAEVEPTRNADEPDATPADNDESVFGSAGSGGGGPGIVAPPPGTEWPDPMGGDDEERELERRTR